MSDMDSKRMVGTMWLHKKTGGLYVVLDVAILQTRHDGLLADMSEMVIYSAGRGSPTCVREKSEFLDGRFELKEDRH